MEGKRARRCKGRKTRVGTPKEGTWSEVEVGGVGHVAPRRAVPAPSSRTPRVGSVPLQPPTQRLNRLAGWLADWLVGWLLLSSSPTRRARLIALLYRGVLSGDYNGRPESTRYALSVKKLAAD